MPIPVTTTRRSAAIWRVVLEVAKVRVWETVKEEEEVCVCGGDGEILVCWDEERERDLEMEKMWLDGMQTIIVCIISCRRAFVYICACPSIHNVAFTIHGAHSFLHCISITLFF